MLSLVCAALLSSASVDAATVPAPAPALPALAHQTPHAEPHAELCLVGEVSDTDEDEVHKRRAIVTVEQSVAEANVEAQAPPASTVAVRSSVSFPATLKAAVTIGLSRGPPTP